MTRTVAVAASALALLMPARSFATTLTFNEFGSSQLVSANNLQTSGITISFTPGQAYYNGLIGSDGHSVFAVDPVLTGPTTGILTVSFGAPTNTLAFDIVLQSIMPIGDSSSSPDGGPAYIVNLSSGANYSEATSPQPGGLYSEGQFRYSGPAISGASLSFYYGQDPSDNTVGAFALDNLTFDSGESTSTPEGGTLCMVGAGLVVLSLLIRQSTKQSRHRHSPEYHHSFHRRIRLVRLD
jgi:hypothetical protein